EACSDRVQRDVGGDREEVLVSLDQGGVEASLEEMTDPPVPPVEPLRGDPVQLPHAAREGRPGSLDEEVVVVAHLAVSEDEPAEALDSPLKGLLPAGSVGPVSKDALPGGCTGRVRG